MVIFHSYVSLPEGIPPIPMDDPTTFPADLSIPRDLWTSEANVVVLRPVALSTGTPSCFFIKAVD